MFNYASQIIRDFIKSYEKLMLKSYLCPAGVWTIGWGTTIYPDGNEVKQGDVCNKEQALFYFSWDLDKFSNFINKIVKTSLNQNQFDALLSFVYNAGEGNFSKSTMLRKLNSNDCEGAAAQFMNWTKARNPKTGLLKILKGLVTRRKKEMEIFLTPIENKIDFGYFEKIKARGYAVINSRKFKDLIVSPN